MELIKFNPFVPAPAFNSRINRLFDDFFTDASRHTAPKLWSPKVDIYEKEGTVTIQADLPGIEKTDLSIKVEEGILTLKGERKIEEECKEKTVYRTERFTGRFERAFRLPPNTDVDHIDAEFKNGVLHITIPSTKEPSGKEISIH